MHKLQNNIYQSTMNYLNFLYRVVHPDMPIPNDKSEFNIHEKMS